LELASALEPESALVSERELAFEPESALVSERELA
jgi:hypothetical protein